jgi:hypothetical protein
MKHNGMCIGYGRDTRETSTGELRRTKKETRLRALYFFVDKKKKSNRMIEGWRRRKMNDLSPRVNPW